MRHEFILIAPTVPRNNLDILINLGISHVTEDSGMISIAVDKYLKKFNKKRKSNYDMSESSVTCEMPRLIKISRLFLEINSSKEFASPNSFKVEAIKNFA